MARLKFRNGNSIFSVTDDSIRDAQIGTLSSLNTTEKGNLVGAINEVKGSIPTKTSQLSNNSGFITSSSVPTKTSQLTNDSGFITSSAIPSVPTKTSQLTNDSGYITSSSVPTKVSQLTNDSGYITGVYSHASTGTGYGAGNGSYYGYVKLSDTYASNVGAAANAIGASQTALYNVYSKFSWKVGLSNGSYNPNSTSYTNNDLKISNGCRGVYVIAAWNQYGTSQLMMSAGRGYHFIFDENGVMHTAVIVWDSSSGNVSITYNPGGVTIEYIIPLYELSK